MDRPDWDTYFLILASNVALRAECTRRRVGAVLVKDNRIISTGYNGAPAKEESCLEGACPRGRLSVTEVAPGSSYDTGPGSCIAIHAEANALLYAPLTPGSTLYVATHAEGSGEPCGGCLRLIRGAHVERVVWSENFEIKERRFN